MQKPCSTLGVSLSHDKKVAIFRSCDERRTEKKKNLSNKRPQDRAEVLEPSSD